MFLMDTNVVAELPRPRPSQSVVSWIASQSEIALCAVTIEELRFGIERLGEHAGLDLRRWLRDLLALPPIVVPIDQQMADLAGRLRARRERAGRRVAQADMLIAAAALATGRTLATRNIRDFEGCGLRLFNPFEASASAT